MTGAAGREGGSLAGGGGDGRHGSGGAPTRCGGGGGKGGGGRCVYSAGGEMGVLRADNGMSLIKDIDPAVISFLRGEGGGKGGAAKSL